VHRRGYRFIAPVSAPFTTSDHRSVGSPPGRETELDRLLALAEHARSGERQVVFISGEPGIGKTTLLEAFLHRLSTEGRIAIARGQCLEHFGAGEAYGPVLGALQHACRWPHGKTFISVLRRRAPTWLPHMPSLVRTTERDAVHQAPADRNRMLRELVDAVVSVASLGPVHRAALVVLALEDLQWSDPSTLDLLNALAHGREPARLLVLATHRPVGGLAPQHPLRTLCHELELRRRCVVLPLSGISEEAVSGYLTRRLEIEKPGDPLRRAARLLRDRTEGNPLFLVNVVEDWLTAGLIRHANGGWTLPETTADVPRRVPRTLQQLVEGQSERLTADERRVLAFASVVGREFSAAAVAAALGVDPLTVDERFAELARRQSFVAVAAASHHPDRRRAGRYRFLHALYQEAWYHSLTPAQRTRAHLRVGEWAERAYGERVEEHAPELAMHFERTDDQRRAGHYHERAGQSALRRFAYREAADHLTKALAALGDDAGDATRTDRELRLQMALGGALGAARGFGDAATLCAYSRTWELARRPDQVAAAFPALCGYFTCQIAQADLQMAREVGEQLVAMARGADDPSLLAQALVRLGQAVYLQGDLRLAEKHIEDGLAFYDPERDRGLAAAYGQDPAVVGLGSGASIAWFLGYPDRACERTRRQLTVARDLAYPSMLAYALYGAAAMSMLYGDAEVTRQLADELIALASKEGFPHWMARGRIYSGWARVAAGHGEDGIGEMREGIAATRKTVAEAWQPYYHGLLADAHGKLGQPREALAALMEAFASMERSGQRVIETELHRMQGEIVLLASRDEPVRERRVAGVAAEQLFLKAIDLARQREHRSFELRAASSLARLWCSLGRRAPARQMLGETYDWFTEGFDTADLREAAALLAELG
jgi:predicted ATPase